MKLIFVFVVLSLTSALAEAPWPQKISAPSFKEVSTATLPDDLRKIMLTYDEFAQGQESLPGSFEICRVKLNANYPAYIIESHQSYSGGPVAIIFEQRGNEFVYLSSLSANMYFAKRVNGYYQLVTESRGGGGQFGRELFQYEDKRYHLKRLTHYQLSDNGASLKFVGEEDPKPHDF